MIRNSIAVADKDSGAQKNKQLTQNSYEDEISTVQTDKIQTPSDNLTQEEQLNLFAKHYIDSNEQFTTEIDTISEKNKLENCEIGYEKKDIELKECENNEKKWETGDSQSETKVECEPLENTVKCESKELNSTKEDICSMASNLGLSQIAEMLEKGLTLPGVEELNIEPTNKNPSPSSMNRLNKPWEK